MEENEVPVPTHSSPKTFVPKLEIPSDVPTESATEGEDDGNTESTFLSLHRRQRPIVRKFPKEYLCCC